MDGWLGRSWEHGSSPPRTTNWTAKAADSPVEISDGVAALVLLAFALGCLSPLAFGKMQPTSIAWVYSSLILASGMIDGFEERFLKRSVRERVGTKWLMFPLAAWGAGFALFGISWLAAPVVFFASSFLGGIGSVIGNSIGSGIESVALDKATQRLFKTFRGSSEETHSLIGFPALRVLFSQKENSQTIAPIEADFLEESRDLSKQQLKRLRWRYRFIILKTWLVLRVSNFWHKWVVGLFQSSR